MRKLVALLMMMLFVGNIIAQDKPIDKKFIDWYNKDLKKDKIFGVSAEKAYAELLQGKTPITVVVAVIDGGTDIYHEDLQGVIWTNKKEIPGNGIDDDKNGYIDDIHGWNFIGNANGENVNEDNLEITRVYKQLHAKYEKADAALNANNPEYKLYQEVKLKFEKKQKEAKMQYNSIAERAKQASDADSVLKAYFNKTAYTKKDMKKINSTDETILKSKEVIEFWMARKVGVSELIEYEKYFGSQYKYQYNLDFDSRKVVGDNYMLNSSPYYGNNDVKGPRSGHGTVVAGNIGAVCNNGKGANGVACNVQMMIIRVVPDGDERDKDVANGILYAINNGAKVINMSFGKAYSPQKHFVDSVVRLAKTKDVVLVHAAGNDAENNDEVGNFPDDTDVNGKEIIDSWITVGASSIKAGKNLPARFSNYGKTKVDVFAPGVDLYGLEPENKYGLSSGTSMASPVVAGIVAVIRGYYPQLSAAEVKEIIIKSAVKFEKEVEVPGEDGSSAVKSFTELSVSGGVANLYAALLLADEYAKKKH